MKRLLSENLFEKYKIDDFESFFKRKNESIKFSQLSDAQSQIVYMLFDYELKDPFTSFTTSRKSNSKQSNNIIDEDIIDENIATNKNAIDEDIIDKDIVTSKDVIVEDIFDKDVITNKDIIDKNSATNKDIIDKDIITSKDVIEKINTKETDTKRSRRDQMNDCDCREFDET
jgi:hypothetical protein